MTPEYLNVYYNRSPQNKTPAHGVKSRFCSYNNKAARKMCFYTKTSNIISFLHSLSAYSASMLIALKQKYGII